MKTTAYSSNFDETVRGRLGRLRDLLATDGELAEAFDYFHQALVPDEGFLRSGSAEESPRLLAVIGGVLRAIVPGGVLRCPMILRVEKYAMCHGCAFWGGGIALFFFFEELDLGLCSYQRSADSDVRFARFSVSEAGNGWQVPRQRGST